MSTEDVHHMTPETLREPCVRSDMMQSSPEELSNNIRLPNVYGSLRFRIDKHYKTVFISVYFFEQQCKYSRFHNLNK